MGIGMSRPVPGDCFVLLAVFPAFFAAEAGSAFAGSLLR
jgi:hypothetical protein